MLSLAVAKGFPRWLARAVGSWLAGSRRFLAYRGCVGDPMATTIGVPQGNAISVTLAIVWASEWYRQVASLVNQGSFVVAYLDDFSVSCLSSGELKRCVGATVCFAERWKIQLNPRKCCVVVSEHAEGWDLHELDLPKEETWDFLGMSLGHGKESKRSADRVDKAMGRVRRVKSFAGTLNMKATLTEMMVVSPCWGLSFEPGSGMMRRSDPF